MKVVMNKGFNSYARRYRDKIKTEINVTPFVDIMLVLLIIFMLTSHMITTGIDINLPSSTENFSKDKNYISISVDKESTIYIQENVIKKEELIKKVKALLKENPAVQILLHGDKEVNYGEIIQIFNILKQASIYNVVLVTEE